MQRQVKRAFVSEEARALKDLFAMLRTMRPAWSHTETRFIREWLTPLGMNQDSVGNLFKQIGGCSPVLWSCHTDTVHRKDGPQRIEQNGDLIKLAWNEKRATCLGADCTTGVWIMREMILANVPGLYIFHRAEECGGIGSSHIAKSWNLDQLGIQYAIAFDRHDKGSIITYQGGLRTASDAFAESIAVQLPGIYTTDDGGIFTDTANYAEIIPECTNLSVGYMHNHWKRETQSISHALALRDAMLRIDASQFVCERDPRVVDALWAAHCYGRVNQAALIDGPWDEIEDKVNVGEEVWVKRNGEWYVLDEFEEDDPLRFGDWSPPRQKW